MRTLLSWIWSELSSTTSSITSNYLTSLVAVIAGIAICASVYLYQALHIEQQEKEQALAQIAILEKTVSRLQQARDTENNIAHILIKQSDIWNTLNTQVALEIAELPRFEWESKQQRNSEITDKQEREQKSKQRNNQKNV